MFNLNKIWSLAVILAFLANTFLPTPCLAQEFNINQLPIPGTLVAESASFKPLVLKGLIVNPQKPLAFQFILDTGQGTQDRQVIQAQAPRLLQYFLTGLTVPESELWVNLSPYEKNRITPPALGQTLLGRDLLAQDYILKQLTASFIYPEKQLGQTFWRQVYKETQEKFGTTAVAVNTFNKVWILPDETQVFTKGSSVYITKATLKVMLDSDYLATYKHHKTSSSAYGIEADLIRQIVIPQISKEVNSGAQFASLRQAYYALILAKWYKQTIQNELLDTVYLNKNRMGGINLSKLSTKQQIYERYLQAYKKGVFNYIKDIDTSNGVSAPRKYFSGGIVRLEPEHIDVNGTSADVESDGAMMSLAVTLTADQAQLSVEEKTLKPGVTLASIVIDPHQLSPHILVAEELQGRLHAVDRQNGNFIHFINDQDQYIIGENQVRTHVPRLSTLLDRFHQKYPDQEVMIKTSNENLFYNTPVVTVIGHKVYHAQGVDIEKRIYSMYVIWKDGHISLENNVRFKYIDQENNLAKVFIAGQEAEIQYATLIILAGNAQGFQPPSTREQAFFYDDIRLLFSLPRLSHDEDPQIPKGVMSGGIYAFADQLLEKSGRRVNEYFSHPDRRQEFKLTAILTVFDGGKLARRHYQLPIEILEQRLAGIGYTHEDYTIDREKNTINIRLRQNGYALHLIGETNDGQFKEMVVNGSWGPKGLPVSQTMDMLKGDFKQIGIIDQGTSIRMEANGVLYAKPSFDKDGMSRATSLIIYTKKRNGDPAQRVGGIDLSHIQIHRQGNVVKILADRAQLEHFMNGDFEGFHPRIAGITPMTREQFLHHL